MKRFISLLIVLISVSQILTASDNLITKASIPLQDTIIGYFDFEQLRTEPYNSWYEAEYSSYPPDTAILQDTQMQLLKNVEIIVIIGTWCSDSQRETPRFVKILNYLEYNTKDIIAIGVNQNKKAPYTEVDELNIQYVPTIIFKYEGKEIGRIIESPEESLEQDMLTIISSI